jgi:2-dehydropantoate 2-reductase
MKILVVGAGAVGGYFGGRLAQAGRDVAFLVREKRAQALREGGLRIMAPDGEADVIPVETVTAGSLGAAWDVILLAVKSFALDKAVDDFAPAVGERTVVIPFLNGMRHMDTLTGRFGRDRVYGGVCYVATELRDGGTVVQLNGLQSISYGPWPSGTDDRSGAVHAALSGAGFESAVSEASEQDMWEKWMFLAGVGAATTLMRGDLGQVNRARGGAAFTSSLTRELISVAAAAGFPLRRSAEARLVSTLGDTQAPTTSSMYRDLTVGLPLESDPIIGDLARRAEGLGLDVPLLRLADTNLAVYGAMR